MTADDSRPPLVRPGTGHVCAECGFIGGHSAFCSQHPADNPSPASPAAGAFTCPDCGGTEFELWLGGKRSGTVTCRGCGSAFETPAPEVTPCPDCGTLLAYSHSDGCPRAPRAKVSEPAEARELRAAWDACRSAVQDALTVYDGQAATYPDSAAHALAVAVHMAAQDLQGVARDVMDRQRRSANWGWIDDRR